MLNCRQVAVVFGALFLAPSIASADTYTLADFSGAINPGGANVKSPFNTNGFTQGDPISGSFVFDNQLVPAAGSGFTNIFFSSFPDIAAIPPATAFNITLDSLHFTLADDLTGQIQGGIQYNNGHFNGLEFITDFAFLGSEYQFQIDGPVITVLLLDQNGNPTGGSLINALLNTGDANLTGETPFTPGVAATPLPGALPLFGTVLGAGYFLTKRRKRRALEVAIA